MNINTALKIIKTAKDCGIYLSNPHIDFRVNRNKLINYVECVFSPNVRQLLVFNYNQENNVVFVEDAFGFDTDDLIKLFSYLIFDTMFIKDKFLLPECEIVFQNLANYVYKYNLSYIEDNFGNDLYVADLTINFREILDSDKRVVAEGKIGYIPFLSINYIHVIDDYSK